MPLPAILIALLSWLGLPAVLPAQDSIVVPLGVRVRLTTDAGRFVGTWGGRASDSLTILDARRNTVRVVAVSAVRAFEISRGKVRRTGRGALIGLVSGAGAGVVTGLVLCRNDCGDFGGLITVVLAGGGAVAGTGLGALIGSQVRSERWDGGPFGVLRVGLFPQRSRGLGVAFRLAWSSRGGRHR